MLLFVIYLLSQALSQVCLTNTSLGVYLYPVANSEFILPLDKYFKGMALQYSIQTSNVFSIYQSTQYIDTSIEWTPIASGSYNYLGNTNLQSGYYAVLFSDNSAQYVAVLEPVPLGGYTLDQQLTLPIQTCSFVEFVGENIITACVQDSQLQFYIIDTSIEDFIPTVLTTVVNNVNIIMNFQVLNNTKRKYSIKQGTATLVVTYQNEAQDTTLVTFMLQDAHNNNQLTLLQMEQFGDLQIIVNEDQSFFTLNDSTLSFYINNTIITSYTNDKPTFLQFGVYAITLYNQSIDYVIGIQTELGLLNVFYDSKTQDLIQGSFIEGLQLGSQLIDNQIIVSNYYVILPLQTNIVVLPSFLNPYPYIITTIENYGNGAVTFDYRSDVVIQFTNNGYAQTSLTRAYLGLAPDSDNLQTGSGVITITASSLKQQTCSINFHYTFVTFNDAFNMVQSLPNATMLFPQPYTQVLSPFFYGNNLSYSAESSLPNQHVIIESVKLLFTKNYYSNDFVVFSKIMQNPYSNNSYIQLVQENNGYLTIISGGAQFDELELYRSFVHAEQIVAASVGTNSDGLIVLTTATAIQEFINIYTFPYNTVFSRFNSMTSIWVNDNPQQIVDIQCQADLIYALTENPQILQVYQISTSNYLYNFEYSGEFTPNAIYTNDWSYGGYLFIDNQYELIITQCYLTQCITSQQITYQSNDATQSIGIGLLADGIYIAITNGVTQSLVFYPREVIHSLYLSAPTPQIAVIPATIEFQFPIIASYTDYKFYLGWLNNACLELAIFQPAYSIANILYSSTYIQDGFQFNSISSASVYTDYTYDVIAIVSVNYSVSFIQYKVWSQANAQLTTDQMNSMIQDYTITYYSQTPQSTQVSINQDIIAVDNEYYIASFQSAQGNPSQVLLDYCLIALQPELYFNGSIENYGCYIQDTSSGTNQAMNIIGPILDNNIMTQSQLISASTGYVYKSSFEQAFFVNSSYLFGYNPASNQQNYTEITALPMGNCPILFNTYYYLVSICLEPSFATLPYIYNKSSEQFEVIQNTYLGSAIIAQDIQYVNATSEGDDPKSDSSYGVLAIWVDVLLMYQVQSTPQGVTIQLVAQDEGIFEAQDYDCTLQTILAKNADRKLFGSLVMCITQTSGYSSFVYLSYAYGFWSLQDQNWLYSLQINFPGIEINEHFMSKQYQTNSTNYMLLVIQNENQGAIFSFSLRTLERYDGDNKKTIQTQQNYTLQRIENYISVGLFVEGSLIVTQFEFTNATYNSTIIALYQDPQFSKQTDQLTFKALYYFDSILYNTTLTSNGTLIYNTYGFVQQLYLTSQLFVEFDLTSPLVQVIQNGSYNNLSAPIVVVAQNSKYNATQQVNINAYTVNGGVQKQQAPWYFIGFGIGFAVIIFSVLGTLCYKSRQQYQDYLN